MVFRGNRGGVDRQLSANEEGGGDHKNISAP